MDLTQRRVFAQLQVRLCVCTRQERAAEGGSRRCTPTGHAVGWPLTAWRSAALSGFPRHPRSSCSQQTQNPSQPSTSSALHLWSWSAASGLPAQHLGEQETPDSPDLSCLFDQGILLPLGLFSEALAERGSYFCRRKAGRCPGNGAAGRDRARHDCGRLAVLSAAMLLGFHP